ncbi:hypothetical protein Agub_g5994, partial [Astrephomene gubernaculifera]
ESLGAKLLEAADETTRLQHQTEAATEALRGQLSGLQGRLEAAARQLEGMQGELEAAVNRGVQLQRRIACMSGQEEALAAQSLDTLEALAQQAEAALPRLRHAIVAARVAAARSEAAEAVEAATCAVCLAARRDTFLNCGHIICQDCAERLELCPLCRAHINHRSRAFV